MGVGVWARLCVPGLLMAERRERVDVDGIEAARREDSGSEEHIGVGVLISCSPIVGVVSLSEERAMGEFALAGGRLLSPEVPKADNDRFLMDGDSTSISRLPRSRGGTVMLSVLVPVRVSENEWWGRAMMCVVPELRGDEILWRTWSTAATSSGQASCCQSISPGYN